MKWREKWEAAGAEAMGIRAHVSQSYCSLPTFDDCEK